MMYCDRIHDYVEQDTHCMNCIFYIIEKDSCEYAEWIPGMIKEDYNEGLEGFPQEHI